MKPVAYFITFSTYGAWLHGDDRGSVDRDHNRYGDPVLPGDRGLNRHRRGLMTHPVYVLDAVRRGLVLRAVLEHAGFRGWAVLAAHVRTRHVHLVVWGDGTPERIMNEVKAYASRALNRAGIDQPNCRRWTRHGSTRHLFADDVVQRAIRYTIDEQGEKMATYEAPYP
jgi:REP element-mobilizing transposase RayT